MELGLAWHGRLREKKNRENEEHGEEEIER